MYYNVPVVISKQEDGLWRAEVPVFQGCFVDAATLEEALSEVQEAAALFLDVYIEEQRPLPEGMEPLEGLPPMVALPIVHSEYKIRRYPVPGKSARR
jgi:predicted RNase H-like HicB family nuclease